MTLQTYGTFGFLNPGQLAEEPLMLLDFGIEKRQSEKYDFYNDDRDYDGFLFQYTFQGEGVFETEEGSRRPVSYTHLDVYKRQVPLRPATAADFPADWQVRKPARKTGRDTA